MLVGDSAGPLTAYPTSWSGKPIVGWGFYLGGDTPHPWTDAEVAELKRHYRYLLPIYTRSDPQGTAEAAADAAAALARMRGLGQPRGTLVQLDYETAVAAAYEQNFDAAVVAAGYRTELYGSATTVVRNPRPSGGYDEADWTGADGAPGSTAVQFADEGGFDLNDFADDAPLWDTRPPAAPPEPQEVPVIIVEFAKPPLPGGTDTWAVWSGGVLTPIPASDGANLAAVLPHVAGDAALAASILASAPPTAAQIQAAVQAGVGAALASATGAVVASAIEAAVAAAGQSLAAKLTA